MKRILATLGASGALLAGLVGSAMATPTYLAASFSSNSIYFLDERMAPISSFAVQDMFPNAVGSKDSLIFAAYFTSSSVVAYNYSGVEQFRWSNPGLYRVQGIALIDDYLAAASDDTLFLFDARSGTYVAQLTLGEDTVEGLAYDGHYLWSIGTRLVARDFVTGGAVKSIPNAAFNCPMGGTGIAADTGSTLMLGCSDGRWFKVSQTDGSVITSGTNGIDMFDLARITAVPEPSHTSLALLGLAVLTPHIRRRSKTTVKNKPPIYLSG